jgi:hypothetical protein
MDAVTLWGAALFGVVIGWYVYYVNRYRRSDVQLTDIVTVVGAIGGAAILRLFNAGTDLFGAYGIGLAAGFFAYFLVLLILVLISSLRKDGSFTFEWFLDGRRKDPPPGVSIPSGTGVTARPFALPAGDSAAGDISVACGGAAGSWQSRTGQDIAVRLTIRNNGACILNGLATNAQGLQTGLAIANPGTTEIVAISAASRIVFSCQGNAAAGNCTGNWRIEEIGSKTQ